MEGDGVRDLKAVLPQGPSPCAGLSWDGPLLRILCTILSRKSQHFASWNFETLNLACLNWGGGVEDEDLFALISRAKTTTYWAIILRVEGLEGKPRFSEMSTAAQPSCWLVEKSGME